MIDLSERVAVVTGAGAGLGRAHALLLARHGAHVIVNDLTHGAARQVADEISNQGGTATAYATSVTDFDDVRRMFEAVITEWGRIDILVNNAGILRDKTFSKMSLEEFRLVMDVHVMGSVHCTKVVWDHMRERNYGRIVMTTSSSGLFGNYGQSNYGAAKMALVGLMRTLALEGARNNIHVNCIAPTAATAMLEGLLPPEAEALLQPEMVSPAVLALASQEAPTGQILSAGAGSFEQAHITLTQGLHLGSGADAADRILTQLAAIGDQQGQITPASGREQSSLELAKAGFLFQTA